MFPLQMSATSAGELQNANRKRKLLNKALNYKSSCLGFHKEKGSALHYANNYAVTVNSSNLNTALISTNSHLT